ncbi:NAD(P)H-binding protein [Cellulophaga sp. BC115SP]|uniref:NAD-dependent epimerase/dehydratase family protein n=1 Tax=Cellulophaga sp. BC115SP TaxID=2683263 RepID=UPI00141303B8|nr:NAD(P)H-binding protein [Cellulophaga sp. BC115SP]NBB30502.1 NAD(P)H-binding protein [Cellulophaga sp. BC115SP]
MNSDILILGGTGSIGYAFTMELVAQKIPVTLLVRDIHKAQQIFDQTPLIEFVEGDVQNGALLKTLAQDKKVIFHGINYSYEAWKGNMQQATQNVIEAASLNKAQIIFPGNIYNYGLIQTPIMEESPENPCAVKGQIRVELEAMMRTAAQNNLCKLLIVRLPDFWGPNVMNEGVRPIFANALKGKPMRWLCNMDIPHQTVYTPDAAKIMVELMKIKQVEEVSVYNYGGQVHASMRTLFAKIAEQAGQSAKYQLMSKWMINLLAIFIPVLKEIKEMTYLYENTVVLNDDKLRRLFPEFKETPLEEAIKTALSWKGYQS